MGRIPRSGEPDGGFEHQRVDEGLRQVAPELSLVDVVLLGEERRGAAGSPVALEVADRGELVALLVAGEGGEKSAQQESSFGLGKRTGLLAEPVDVAFLRQFVLDGSDSCGGARVAGGYGTTDA